MGRTIRTMVAMITVAGCMAIVPGIAAANTTVPSGTTIPGGGTIVSGSHTLAMQSDGNLVLYDGSQATWQSHTYPNPGARAVMQTDGNLVVYSGAKQPLFQTGTYNNSGAHLVVQDDGNMVIYAADGRALWATNSASASNTAASGSNTPVNTPQSLTKQVCRTQSGPLGNEYRVCLTGTNSYNGQAASGYVAAVGCQTFLLQGAAYACNHGTGQQQGGYRTSSGVWEDWLNQAVAFIEPVTPYVTWKECVYLRIDTSPDGTTTSKNFEVTKHDYDTC